MTRRTRPDRFSWELSDGSRVEIERVAHPRYRHSPADYRGSVVDRNGRIGATGARARGPLEIIAIATAMVSEG